jgi:hypothetical protein
LPIHERRSCRRQGHLEADNERMVGRQHLDSSPPHVRG